MVLTAGDAGCTVTIELCVASLDPKVTPHTRSELGPDFYQFQRRESDPEVDRPVVGDSGIAGVLTQAGKDPGVPGGYGTDGCHSTKGEQNDERYHLHDTYDNDEPRCEGWEGLHFVSDVRALTLELGGLLTFPPMLCLRQLCLS